MIKRRTQLVIAIVAMAAVSRVLAAAPRAQLPIAFVENQGQWDDRALFAARQGGLTAYFTRDGFVLQLVSNAPNDRAARIRRGGKDVFEHGAPSNDASLEAVGV